MKKSEKLKLESKEERNKKVFVVSSIHTKDLELEISHFL